MGREVLLLLQCHANRQWRTWIVQCARQAGLRSKIRLWDLYKLKKNVSAQGKGSSYSYSYKLADICALITGKTV